MLLIELSMSNWHVCIFFSVVRAKTGLSLFCTDLFRRINGIRNKAFMVYLSLPELVVIQLASAFVDLSHCLYIQLRTTIEGIETINFLFNIGPGPGRQLVIMTERWESTYN